ncbi:hypothetical protein TTHERM_00085360 (macronuclear) [Tetrahymena thermophila SB210]|uniref:Protein kinase domain-containing protein n=1 Tax=Tetrahymena thermophila (strain SB210) TaxID=312017 RepID=Q236R2_TETTS|nr:hypothetical protein TTHERM_00085360 [Tetrahymena thermophila SB210]EAR92438.2 hypothetical protein TTHERM_00085360 [Tetrahymena thermophila SB210]|eukprot:XP_001012683.2 hypothetical protein TTHERM_00085360 [Tetrahymena thermophila SB210]
MIKKTCSNKPKKVQDLPVLQQFASIIRNDDLQVQIEADKYYQHNIENQWSNYSDSSSSDISLETSQKLSFLDTKDQESKKIEQYDKEKSKIDNKKIIRFGTRQEENEESKRRTRQRSYNEDEEDQQSKELYFSITGKNPLQQNVIQKKRNMKDIVDNSLQTSHHIKNQSFKWSTNLKYPSNTFKKGMINAQDKQALNQQNLKQKNNFQIQQDFKQQQNIYESITQNGCDQQSISQMFESFENFANIQYYIQDTQKRQQEKKDNVLTHQIMKHFKQLDKGSFGKVDLYFIEIDYILKENLQIQQQNLLLSSQNSNQSYSTQASNETIQNSIQMLKQKSDYIFTNSSADYQNSMFSEGGLQQKTSKENQTWQNSHLSLQQSTSNMKKQLLPVAGKQINVQSEFIRELYIMETVNCEYMPKLLNYDVDNQILFMELGLCNLYDLKIDSIQNEYDFTDEFTYSILINLIQAVESLLKNYNQKEKKQQPLFHSDIKPQNIMLTVKKSEDQLLNTQLILIDYGGASFQLDDYWSYYTPAFVCNQLWQKLVNSKNNWEYLTWPQVRYAEIYAACRSVQFLLIESLESNLFKKENTGKFIEKYSQSYPKTCRILENVLIKNKSFLIFSDYRDILYEDEISECSKLNHYPIYFDQSKLFQISKFYKIINQK